MHGSQFYAGSDSFITYTLLSLLASTGSEIMNIQFHIQKTMKRNVLAKLIDALKIKFN